MKKFSAVKKSFIKKKAEFLKNRSHRSFRLTRRRDYVKELKLPGYWSFTFRVFKLMRKNLKTFLLLILVSGLLTGFLVGLASQGTYSALTEASKDVAGGQIDKLGESFLLLFTIASGDISNDLTEVQRVYSALIGLFTWLVTLWLVRNIMSGSKVKLRDGLYSAGSPILSTLLVALAIFVQLLPLAIAMLGYAAAVSSGLLNGGIEAMLFWLVAGLLTGLSLYWLTSTFLALIIVTLPGMYPWQALQAASGLVMGRKVRILLRLLWLGLSVAVVWGLVMVPMILLDSWVKGLWPVIEWLPIIPTILLFMSSATVVWSSTYVYMLYRGIVENES